MVIVLASVTKKDYVNNVKGYVNNVKGYGIANNLDLIKSLPNVARLGYRRLLAAYCSHLANKRHFPEGQTVLNPTYLHTLRIQSIYSSGSSSSQSVSNNRRPFLPWSSLTIK